MKISKVIIFISIFLVLLVSSFILLKKQADEPELKYDLAIIDFESCVNAGNPIMESYPRQCKTADGRNFTEDIGNALEKQNLIRIDSPSPNAIIVSPLRISGEARGNWYFEASFPVVLLDGNDSIIAQHYAQAQGEWMTQDFVPFESELTFTKPATKTGSLILKKDNPSGLPEYDDELIIPINFE